MTRRLTPGPVRLPVALPVAAMLLLLGLTVTGCDSHDGAESAGPTPSVVGPAELWPDLPPPPAEDRDGLDDEMAEAVPGIDVPGGDLRRVDPVAIVQAEAAANPDTYTGVDALPDDTASAVAECGMAGSADADCPVLEPYYRDMTGNGEDELIVGIEFSDGSLGIRCYQVAPDGKGLIRIMSTAQPVNSVEVAARDLIVHSPAHIADYEYRDVWSWDAQQKAMIPKRLEIIPARPDGTSPVPSAVPLPNPSPRTGPSASPSPSPSPSAARS
ncbi:hypothetical protein [Streptomyces apocyni]|uniref:hypothetical protein n=1 Tax=Streptomyces apocyni TaxID=2654677 RepID=UPI001E5A4B1E|nr:hypothetical protein [Streptomyces apocyni]